MIRYLAAPLFVALFAAAPSYAGDTKTDVPNVVIVKTKTDQAQQPSGQSPSNQQLSDDATLTPVTVTLHTDAQGNVDMQQLMNDANQAQQSAQSIPLQGSQSIATSSMPSAVQQVLQQAGQNGTERRVRWGWYNNWNNGGFYGYGYYPNYGYNSGYNAYNPYYGYYYGGYTYPYYYGASYPYGAYNYNYYWRW